ncbi:MAG: HAMP domain-containing sensor histidine kinase [Polyangiaceae bacterium]
MTDFDGLHLDLAQVGAALAVCDRNGRVVGLSAQAKATFERVGIDSDVVPFSLPHSLWTQLGNLQLGDATEWSPEHDPGTYLGCSPYLLGDSHLLLVMREVSDKRLKLSRALHRQRLESTGKLVAAIAHDLRAPLSSIVYNAELLTQQHTLEEMELREVVHDIRIACRRLKRTIDGLLDYARLGPQVEIDLSLKETLERVGSFVRPLLRDGKHSLAFTVGPGAEWVRGNPIVIEQVFVNLVVNATEAKGEGAHIEIEADSSGGSLVRVCVRDDGPGVPAQLRERIFEPFFTTKSKGTGLGLTTSRQAVRDLRGDLMLEPSDTGTSIVVLLPKGQPVAEGAAEL